MTATAGRYLVKSYRYQSDEELSDEINTMFGDGWRLIDFSATDSYVYCVYEGRVPAKVKAKVIPLNPRTPLTVTTSA